MRSTASRRATARLTATVLAVLLAALAASVGATPAGATPRQASSSGEPVVLVPGWMGWPESMNLLVATFRDAGHPTYVLNQNKGFIFDFLPVPSTDTFVNGPRLAALVDQALADTGAEAVHLVGYSYGGVVARHYLKHMGGLSKVRSYVGIGVPQRGVEPACGLPYEEIGHLCPGSAFLRALNAGDDTPGAVAYASIWGDEDGHATVAVDGPVCVRHVPGVPHLGEPFSLAVAAESLQRVQGVPCPRADRFDGTVPDDQGP